MGLLVLGLGGVVVQGCLLALPSLAQVSGADPRSTFVGVENFRVVDRRVWAGAQPSRRAHEELAARGVRLIVNLRTGAADDPFIDNSELLRHLGVDHLRLPIPDGHVPSRSVVDRFVAAVGATDGIVFVHCGGGVGRSSALTAAYQRAADRSVALDEHVAIGPHTLAQLWYVATGDTNVVVRRLSEALDLPRRAVSRLRSSR